MEGVIPSPGQKLYLVSNQVVGRNGKEKVLDRGKLGTKWGVRGTKRSTFRCLTRNSREDDAFWGRWGKVGKSSGWMICT